LAKALKTVRKARGLSQEAFSDVSSRTYMSTLERDLKSPTLHKLAELCEVMEIHPLTLLTLAYAGEPAQGRRAAGAGAPGAGGGVEGTRRGEAARVTW
jgi:transcriptional regulator with XRE-family HTH domain